MGWTKRQFVLEAFDELGLASYDYDLEAEELQKGLRRLDAMMAQWNGNGVRIGYPLPSTPENSDLDTESAVPDWANEAVILNLAIRLAPSYGKIVAKETKIVAKAGYRTAKSRTVSVPNCPVPTTVPLGAGNKPWRNGIQYVRPEADTIDAGPDGPITL